MEHICDNTDSRNLEPIIDEVTAAFVRVHRTDDVTRLAFLASKYPSVDMPLALDQIQGWQTARHKLPSWAATDGIIYPPHLNMEQCSSEQTARYKADEAGPKTSPDLPKGEEMELPLNLEQVNFVGNDADANVHKATEEFNKVAPSPPLRGGRERSPGRSLIDLTGGFGVDFSFMSRNFEHAIYVERNPQLCRIACHNFHLLGLTNVEVINADGVEFLKKLAEQNSSEQYSSNDDTHKGNPSPSLREGRERSPQGRERSPQGRERSPLFIYLDPARRDSHGHKVYNIADCEPDVVSLAPLLLSCADRVMIKLSPMFDWHEAVRELPKVSEVHIVSVKNECKELLVVLDAHQPDGALPTLFCVNDGDIFACMSGVPSMQASSPVLPSSQQRVAFDVAMRRPTQQEDEAGESGAEKSGGVEAGAILLVPNSSIMKAGCFAEVTASFGVSALGENSHLFVSQQPVAGFPGKSFQILSVSSMNKKELRRNLSGISKANISVRNFPMTVDALRRRLKVADGGDVYIFATTLSDGAHVLIITKKLV